MKAIYLIIIGNLLLTASLRAQSSDWQQEVQNLKPLIATSPSEAAERAECLLKGKNKKNVPLLVALARAYWEAGEQKQAQVWAGQARKINAKSPQLSVLEGDMALAEGQVGTACQLYEQAIYFDSRCTDAYLKYAQAYRSASPSQAIQKLTELKAVQPDSPEADRALAEIYYSINRFSKAAEAYARFMDTPVATTDDRVKYAFALFLNHDFERSLAVVGTGLRQQPQHITLNRLALYNNVDLARYAEAEDAARVLFAAPDSALTYLDHRYYGALLTARKHYGEALEHYYRALQKDSTRTAVWLDVSDVCEQQGDYPQAIMAFRRYYASLAPERRTPEQLLQLGRLYYAEGTQDDVQLTADEDSLQRASALLAADSIFAVVDRQTPESYLGDFWRARTRSALDPETLDGLAKPYYEEAMNTLLDKADPRYNSALVECYSYLGYYYLLKEDYPTSRSYWEKILLIDPNHSTATRALEGIR